MSTQQGTKNEPVDVIVIGAGISGLVAAKNASDQGLSVAVLEGNNRVGGRTWTNPDAPGGTLDYGGMFIGETHRELRALGLGLGLSIVDAVPRGTDVTLVNGRRILAPDGVIPQTVEFARELEESFAVLDAVADSVGWDEPWNAPDAPRLDAMTVQTWIESSLSHPEVRRIHEHAVNAVLGAASTEVSMLYWAYYVSECEGIDMLLATRGGAQKEWWVGGTGQITARIAEGLGCAVRLEFPVASVDYTEGAVVVRSTSGETVVGRRVIVAMSPANAHKIRFTPALPQDRFQLQLRAPMGRMAKVQLRFERAFWRPDGFSGAFTDCDATGVFMFPGTKPTDTLETLIGFIGGEYLDAFGALTTEQQQKSMLDVLGTAFGVTPDAPVHFSVTDWSREPWALGGPVTFMPPGLLSSVGAALREPVGPIVFAGTEASPMWSGYMEGAVRAGQAAARAVVGS